MALIGIAVAHGAPNTKSYCSDNKYLVNTEKRLDERIVVDTLTLCGKKWEGPPSQRGKRKAATWQLRVDPDERAMFYAAAEAAGVAFSEWARKQLSAPRLRMNLAAPGVGRHARNEGRFGVCAENDRIRRTVVEGIAKHPVLLAAEKLSVPRFWLVWVLAGRYDTLRWAKCCGIDLVGPLSTRRPPESRNPTATERTGTIDSRGWPRPATS